MQLREPSLDDPADQPKRIKSLLAAKKELVAIRGLCLHLSTGEPDTFWSLGRRLDPIIAFITDERIRRREIPQP